MVHNRRQSLALDAAVPGSPFATCPRSEDGGYLSDLELNDDEFAAEEQAHRQGLMWAIARTQFSAHVPQQLVGAVHWRSDRACQSSHPRPCTVGIAMLRRAACLCCCKMVTLECSVKGRLVSPTALPLPAGTR
jgi:hypothetical protein